MTIFEQNMNFSSHSAQAESRTLEHKMNMTHQGEHPMTSDATQPDTMARAFDAICMLLMPFFLLGAGDDPNKARNAVADLIRAYSPANTQELDLVARVVGFSIAALDNLRLSMASTTLSDTKVLRYRSTAVTLSRSAEQCRVILTKMQTQEPATRPAPRPQAEHQAAAPRTSQPSATKPQAPLPPMSTASLEQAKTEARAMLAGLAKLGAACAPGQGMTAIRIAPEPGAQITASVVAALAEAKNRKAAQTPPRHGSAA
jgi:hypothetical protein